MKRLIGLATLAFLLACSALWLLAQDKTSQPVKKDSSDTDAQQLLLETVGTLAGSHLYQCYLNIGFLADGKAEGTYEEKEVLQILASILAVMDTLDKKLDRISKLPVTKEDREGIEQIRKLSVLLHQQADELQAFWKTADKARGQKYEKIRKEAWAGISKLLDLN